MAFFRRVFDNLLHSALAEGLANSTAFQRFAVWSERAIKEVGVKGKEQGKVLDHHLNRFTEAAKGTTAQLRKDFEQELKKIQEQQQQPKKPLR